MSRALLVSMLGAAVLSGAGACTAFETNLQDTQVDYLQTARENYDKGEQKMTDGAHNEAIKFFDYVKNKFPYSKYAVLAELRTADAHFAREKWIESADAYRVFVRFHPRHEKVAYATFRVAVAYSNEVSIEHWYSPVFSPIENDQSATRDCVRAFDEYLTRFPDDVNVKEAKERRAWARGRLAQADLYAASFDEGEDRWLGAIWRYERVAKEYADSPKAPYALLRAAQIAQDELLDVPMAMSLAKRLLAEHPSSDEAAQATALLAQHAPVPQPPTTSPPKALPREAPVADPATQIPPANPEDPPPAHG